MLTWSSLATSSQINIIININITTYQLMSSIATSTVSRIPHIHIFFSCLRFTLPKSSNNTSQIRIIILFINNRFIASHLSKALFSKEKLSMQQGQACIPLVRFPNPNYGIKNGKFYNKLPSPIMSSPSVPLCVTQRSLSRSRSSVQMQVSMCQIEGKSI